MIERGSPSSRRAWIEICFSQGLHDTFAAVALLAEGVDRNIYTPGEKTGMVRSPSSRRAWIEIPCPSSSPRQCLVALLAEGVDRNQQADAELKQKITSPSSRRAWIEISMSCACASLPTVALLAEGVDRNAAPEIIRQGPPQGRPPRGGRG